MRKWAALVVSAGLMAGRLSPQDTDRRMIEKLQAYLGEPMGKADVVRYSVSRVDLNRDGKSEAVVHVLGNAWCGSAGCTTLILRAESDSYDVIGAIPATNLPILITKHRTKAWLDLVVSIRGRPGEPMRKGILRFDGTVYKLADAPRNRPLTGSEIVGKQTPLVNLPIAE
jgi:hypothetical protein